MEEVLLLGCPDRVPITEDYFVFPNLGLANLAGNMPQGSNVKIAELVVKKRGVRGYVEETVKKTKPTLVGISCMTFQYPSALKLASIVKQVDPEIKTVLGGYHPSLCFQEIGKENPSNIDFLIRGEGEITFNQLCSGKKINQISGLSYKKNNKFVHNPPRPIMKDLDLLELPNRESRITKDGFHFYGVKADVIESSRGCVNGCKFCSIDKFYGPSFRKFGVQRVITDIENAKKSSKAKKLFFVDDNIALDMERLGKLSQEIIEHGHDDIRYIIQGGVRSLYGREKIIKKMAEAGFDTVFLGIESVSQEDLKFYNKEKIVGKTESVIKMLRDHGILVYAFLIIGNPNDTEDIIKRNTEFILKNKIDAAANFVLCPFPKTRLREELIEQNLVTNKDELSKYDGFHANVKTHHLTPEQLENMWLKGILEPQLSPTFLLYSQYMRRNWRYLLIKNWKLSLKLCYWHLLHKLGKNVGSKLLKKPTFEW